MYLAFRPKWRPDLEEIKEELAKRKAAREKAQEELDAIRPDLDGKAIMDILGIKPSPLVGKAYDYLLELRLEHGPLGEEKAKAELLNWWKENAPKT